MIQRDKIILEIGSIYQSPIHTVFEFDTEIIFLIFFLLAVKEDRIGLKSL